MMNIDKISGRFNQVAEKYDEQRRFFIPCFDDYYATSISFLKSCRNDFNSILDLGAGTGLLTNFLFDKYPEAHFTLVDISGKMLEISKLRFQNLNNFEYIISDYSQKLPAKKHELIASGLSIHHLNENEKKNLYLMIFENLENNGYFINIDQFNAESNLLNNNYNKYWYNYIYANVPEKNDIESWKKRRELDRENTIDETKGMLKKAGFSKVECIYSFMKFAVILAVK
ncbi:MAG: methyltransferase domain-containing protein [Spirochaetes bacterium]|nr:methyltransferase domain-containing protein [Spirochaetota bacterium]